MIRLIGYFFGIATFLGLLVAGVVGIYIGHLTKDLPDYEVLARYEPPVTTRIHASDGSLMGEFARERRLYLPIQAVPDRVKAAFLSAEDKNFYNHPGIDITGLGRALITNFKNMGAGKRPVGASTITQQVAKNFLLSSDQTIDRKIKEMILAFRIEQAYSKDRILELYVNEIFFGLGSYGIAGAALTYYDKSVNELTVAEAAYLAALPKGPSNYHPFKNTERAIERRNWVIDQMVDNGYVTREEGEKAKAEPLEREAAPIRHLPVRRRVFHRGGAPRDHRALRRERALRGRIVGAHDARPEAAAVRAQGAAERAGQVRHAARLSRPVRQDRHLVRRLGRAAGCRQGSGRRSRMAPGGGS